MKAINRKYYNLDDPTLPSYASWDMADDDGNIVVPDLETYSNGSTQSTLDTLIDQVVRDNEGGL